MSTIKQEIYRNNTHCIDIMGDKAIICNLYGWHTVISKNTAMYIAKALRDNETRGYKLMDKIVLIVNK